MVEHGRYVCCNIVCVHWWWRMTASIIRWYDTSHRHLMIFWLTTLKAIIVTTRASLYPTTMTVTNTDLSNEELASTLEERMIAEEYKIWKKNTPCEIGLMRCMMRFFYRDRASWFDFSDMAFFLSGREINIGGGGGQRWLAIALTNLALRLAFILLQRFEQMSSISFGFREADEQN